MFISQQPDVSLHENNELQDDAHTSALNVDKAPDENVLNPGDTEKSAMDGVNSLVASHIEEENVLIQPSDNAENQVNPVDRNLNDEMMDMESELNNQTHVVMPKLVDYQSTSEPDRE